MPRSYRRTLAAFAITASLSLLTTVATGVTAAVPPATQSDGLSGTWQVSRVCLTLCTNPRPVLKVVHHVSGAVFMTGGHTPQVLYLLGTQVLVHGPKDSLVLTIRSRGRFMSGSGVGADGSTFKTTWRCVAAAGAMTATTSMTPQSASAMQPSSGSAMQPRQAPLAIEVC